MCEESACTDAPTCVRDANRPPTNPVERSENTHFCLTFDDIGRRAWTALASKVQEVHSRFRYMLMLGLSPTTLRHSWVHAPSSTPARVSENCCRPRINLLLYRTLEFVDIPFLFSVLIMYFELKSVMISLNKPLVTTTWTFTSEIFYWQKILWSTNCELQDFNHLISL